MNRSPARDLGGNAPASTASVSVGSDGVALVEILISMGVLMIGILAVALGGRAVRLQAGLASRRGAEALAAQRVLESIEAWPAGEAERVDTVELGVHEIVVRLEPRDSLDGFVWLRVTARSTSGGRPWGLWTARRVP